MQFFSSLEPKIKFILSLKSTELVLGSLLPSCWKLKKKKKDWQHFCKDFPNRKLK